MKKSLSILIVLLFSLALLVGISQATTDKGPPEMVLKSSIDPAKKTKLAFFPHAQHQEMFGCETCHHTKDAEGKPVAYKDDQKKEKCESCHNTKAGINEKLDTFKKAAHARCKACHLELKKADKDAGPTKCVGCHKKDLK